jgi:small subunit ribosomal protein S1
VVNGQDNHEASIPQGGAEETSPRPRNQLRELVEESFQQLREGDVVRGTVVAVTDTDVVVDVGCKSEGMIPRSEFQDASGQPAVKVGDEVDVLVEHYNEMLGEIKLSRERAAKIRLWEVLETAFREGATVRGRVTDRVKGGLAVDIGVRAFLPGSLVDMRPSRRLEDYIGEELEARIINFDRRRANVVLSRKAILEEKLSVQKDETLANLEEGTLVTGAVKNITDYGVFVDLGGIDGLLHVTDISWGRVGHPSEYFKVGDEVKVVVLRVDREKERVSLGYRQRFEDPWTHVEERYPVGKKVPGKVTNVVDYGAFVEVEQGVEGLVHVSEMSWTKKIKNPKSMLQAGHEVEVVVTEVDVEKRRLSLSLRQGEPNPWEEFATRYRVGSKVKGLVRNLTDFGAFVELEPGVDGLIHVSDMAWSRRISHPSEVVQKGQEVEAVIIAMDIPSQRISLSLKELQPNVWDEFATEHQVGDEVDGIITNITDFGLFIELAPGVEGLCHVSELERVGNQPLANSFSRGQSVRTRLIRIDWNEKRIGLSLRGIPQPEPEPEAEAQPEPEAEAQPEPEAEAQPEPEAEAQPEPEAEAQPEPEAEAQSEPEPLATAELEPEAERGAAPAQEAGPASAVEGAAEPEPETEPGEQREAEAGGAQPSEEGDAEEPAGEAKPLAQAVADAEEGGEVVTEEADGDAPAEDDEAAGEGER